jgi:hypothetical protein
MYVTYNVPSDALILIDHGENRYNLGKDDPNARSFAELS